MSGEERLVERVMVVHERLRNITMTFHRARLGEFEFTPDSAKAFAHELFVVGCDLSALTVDIARAEHRLEEQFCAISRVVLQAGERLGLNLPGTPAPTEGPLPSNVMVFTGSYRPRPANDHTGGAA